MKQNPISLFHWRGKFKVLTIVLICLISCMDNDVQKKEQMVRLAKLEIDSSQLDQYKAALKEEIETSLRVEPGVIILYAVSEKNDPARITILEIYQDEDAYKKHVQSPHFIKYKTGTQHMVKSLELVETVPVVTGVSIKANK